MRFFPSSFDDIVCSCRLTNGRPNITISRHIVRQHGAIGIAYVEHVPEMRERQSGEHHLNSLVWAQIQPVKRADECSQGGECDQPAEDREESPALAVEHRFARWPGGRQPGSDRRCRLFQRQGGISIVCTIFGPFHGECQQTKATLSVGCASSSSTISTSSAPSMGIGVAQITGWPIECCA